MLARISPEDNWGERARRPVAMGRKKRLFAVYELVGERMADLLSLVETGRLNGLEP